MIATVSRDQLAALAALMPRPEPRSSKRHSHAGGRLDLDHFNSEHDIKVQRIDHYQSGRRIILECCVFDPTHTGSSAAIIELANGAIAYRCFHNSCTNRTFADVRELFNPGWRQRLNKEEASARRNQAASTGEPKPPSDAVPTWAEPTGKCQQPVDGKDLIRDLRIVIRKFVWLTEEQALVVALRVLFTWVFEKVAETNPYLRVLSPLRNGGKSTLLKVLRYSTRAGWLIASSTKSSFVRKTQTGRFTLLIDEGDAFLQENEEMRNVLDAASDPDTANVALSIKQGDNWVPADIDVFIPIVIASIKELRGMGTVEDRSIPIWLKRATKAERKNLTKARRRTLKETLAPIAERCARWAQDTAGQLAGMRPSMDFEDGRDEDKWEPLIGIADYVDAQLGKKARKTAADMIGETAADNQSLPILLLVDIKQLFDNRHEQNDPDADRYPSQDLCRDLGEMEDRPWRAMSSGQGREPKPITQHRLAGMLRDFKIQPHKLRIGALTLNGYEQKDFEDAWERYPPPMEASEEEEKRTRFCRRSRVGVRLTGWIRRNPATPEPTTNKPKARARPRAQARRVTATHKPGERLSSSASSTTRAG